MRRTTQTRIKRITAGVMTALLVLQMTPVAPFASIANAFAAEGEAASVEVQNNFKPGQDGTTQLVTSGIINNYRAAGDMATFTQTLSDKMVSAAVNSNVPLKPAENAAELESALDKDALNDAAETDAAKKVAAEADAAAQAAASELTKIPVPDEDVAKAQALEALKSYARGTLDESNPLVQAIMTSMQLSAEDAISYIEKNIADNVDEAFSGATFTLTDDPVMTATDVKAVNPQVSSASFSGGSITWAPSPTVTMDADASISSSNDVIKDVTGNTNSIERKLTVSKAGEAELSVGYQYSWDVTGFDYTYSYTFDSYTYTPQFTYSGATAEFSMQNPDGSGVPNVITVNLGEITGTIGSVTTEAEFDESGNESVSSVNLNAMSPQSATFSYSFSVTDLFKAPIVGDALTAAGEYEGRHTQPITTGIAFDTGAFADEDFALQVIANAQFEAENDRWAEIAYNEADGTLTVQPKKAIESTKDYTVAWTFPSGDTVTQTIAVTVSRYTTNITLSAQDFRLQEDQATAVLKDANEQVRNTIKTDTEDEITPDYYSGVEFLNYPETGQGTNVSVTFTKNASGEATAAYEDYKIVDPATVTINPMSQVAWSDDNIQLASTNGTSDVAVMASNWESQWINKTPTATWDGHTLAFGTASVPTEADAFKQEWELNAGDGVHQIAAYAKNNDSKVVSEITGVSYKLDTQAPILVSSEASEPRQSEGIGGILFGERQVDVTFSLVDQQKVDNGRSVSSEDESVDSSAVSGLNESSITATYHDTENGTDVSVDNGSITGKNDGDSFFGFVIGDVDRDVPTSSIQITSTDNAGNQSTTGADKATVPMDYVRLVADAAAPEIGVEWDTTAAVNGHYYNTNRSMTITITEAFFNYVQQYAGNQVIANITSTGGANIAVHPSDFTETATNSNVWTYTYHFTTDDDWTVSNVQVTDIVGRSATATGDSFTIDKTAPTMDVAFNTTTDNGYYNAARVATITITEHNFDPSLVNINTTAGAGNGSEATPAQVSGWSSNGDIHTATVTFPGQGVYTMSIDGTDLALNALPSYSCPEFTVDTLTPEITLSGDVAAHANTRYAYAGDAGLGVAVHDTNIDGTRTTINVEKLSTPSDVNPYTANQTQTATDITKSFQNPSDITRDNDGVYRLTVQAVDLAGNTADQSVLWSVNRYGSTYVISAESGELLNTFTNADDLVDIQVTEINVDTLNDDATAVELSRDTTSSTLERDADYTIDHGQSESTGWQEYVYTVNQDTYSEDGAYRLLFHSEDSAANVSENTMPGKLSGGDADDTAEVAFGVDSTAPVVSFVGTLDADTYQQASVPVTVTIEDNLALDHAQIFVNDKMIREITSDELKNASNSFDFEVGESGDRQSVRVVAFDVAGNETTEERANLLINSNPFIQLINNTPLLVGSVVVVVAAAGGAWWFLVGKKRKQDEEK